MSLGGSLRMGRIGIGDTPSHTMTPSPENVASAWQQTLCSSALRLAVGSVRAEVLEVIWSDRLVAWPIVRRDHQPYHVANVQRLDRHMGPVGSPHWNMKQWMSAWGSPLPSPQVIHLAGMLRRCLLSRRSAAFAVMGRTPDGRLRVAGDAQEGGIDGQQSVFKGRSQSKSRGPR
jgi:hypothetical protein